MDISSSWEKFFFSQDEEAKEALIVHYLPLVKFIANKIAISLPPHIDVADLISPGIIGLIKAIEKYDIKSSAKFETYATRCISGAVMDELRSMDWVPRSIRKKSKTLQEAYGTLEEKLSRAPTDEEVAEYLGIDMEEYDRMVLQASPTSMISIYSIWERDKDGSKSTIMDKLYDSEGNSPVAASEKSEMKEMLADAIEALPEQERLVVTLYYFEDMVLKEIGETLGVSESRVSQIHSKAILRLKGRIQKNLMNL